MHFLGRFISTIAASTSQAQRVSPHVFPTTGFTTFPVSEKVEEEKWPWYTPKSFYPVRIGDVLHSKYQILYKLGYGTTSTTWMCRDLERNAYVCMKSLVCDYTSMQREIRAYQTLSELAGSLDLPGTPFVRQALDQFALSHAGNDYHFLIHEPLGVNLQIFQEIAGGVFPTFFVKFLAKRMLSALELIHASNIIHADLQANNILFRIKDESVLKDVEEAEIHHPSSRKITDHSVIFETRDLSGPLTRGLGFRSEPVLCDFGEARTGQSCYMEDIQPVGYRAPEVFLHIPWKSPVDIWNLGCLIWDMACGRHLFSRKGAPDSQSADQQQMAWMVALLGSPPVEVLSHPESCALQFFTEDGKPLEDVPNETLESLLSSSLYGTRETLTGEESAAFLAFIRRMLKWKAEDRASASELLNDPWLKN